MSGSPVIQNGKLVGAVTHVLVDDPTRGYAIFAENFENYIDGKISKEQFSENAIPIRENMKRLEAKEHEQRQVMDAMDAKMDSIAAMKQLLRDFLKTKDLSKEVVEALVKRIVVGVEHAFTVEYKFDFGE